MKIDRSKVAKKSCECKAAVDRILSCDRANLGHVLASLSPWKFGKVNFNDWVDVFDLFDEILAQQTERVDETEWTLKIDKATQKEVSSVCEIVQFSGTLLEHCRGIALYNSFERMTALLESDNLSIVSAALGVLLVCSRRGGFQTHLARAQQDEIVNRLSFMAKAWPAYEYGLTLPLYCSKNAEIPAIATTVSFEVELDENGKWPSKKSSSGFVNRRTLVFENVHRESGVSLLTNKVMGMYSNMPRDVLFELQHKLRLAHSLGDASLRLESVVVRLRSLASVVYWVLLKEYAEFLQPTFYEECFDLLKLPDASALFAVKAEVLKTLATVIQYERNAIMQKIIAASGANYYHGFLPSLTRACVKQLMDKNRKKESNFPPDFILSLLSFLYYYTGYQLGAQSLAQNGILEVLFMLVRSNLTSGCATYITRAVRVIDSASQFDIQVFQSMDGMFIFIHRLSVEIERCRKDLRQEQCVFDVELDINDGTDTVDDSTMEVATEQQQSLPTANVGIQTDEAANLSGELSFSRKSLIRCLISFIKKIIPDLQFSETVRHLMDGNFYNCVKHIIENRDYYGISLFLLAVHTVSTFIMQEPSQLSVLQSRGLTATIFQKLLCDELPASRELFVLLPTIYSALCLNDTGVAEFLKYGSFAKTFGVLVQAKSGQSFIRVTYAATVCEAAASLGAGMDMLVRQQPRLRGPCISQFLGVLVKLDSLCRDPAYKCSTKETPRTTKPKQKETAPRRMRVPAGRGNTHNDDAFGSDETDPSEDEESRSTEMTRENSGAAVDRFGDSVAAAAPKKAALVEESEESKRLPLPLVDYVHNVLRFSDALMSNQSVDEFSKMFVDRNGVTKFFRIFTGPNLPPLCYNQKLISQAAAVFRSVFGYTRNCAIVKEFINEMKSCCLVGTAELLHSSWEMQADSSALMDAFLSDTDIVETDNGVTFFRPLENLLFFVSVWNEFLKNFGGNDWRVGLLREILGSGLVHMLGLIWRALAWEDIRIRAVHLPKSEGKAAADVAQGSAVGAAAQETTQPRGASIGQTVHHPNGVIGQLLILTEGLTNQIRRAFAYIVGLASGSPQRNRRMFSYGRSHPPAYGDPLLLSVIFSVHQSLIRSFSARHTAVPRMWASFMLANIQALQGTLFEDSKRALHPILEKLHTSGLFVTFLRCLVKLVDDDCVWEQKFITSAGPDFKRFLEESLWLIENLLSAVSSPENEDTLDQPTTSFVQSFTKCTSDLLYPLMMGLWKRVMRNHSILSFLLDPLLSLICQATQREHDRLRQKGAGSNEQAASDQRVVRNEMERFVDRSNYERLLDMGFPRELAIDALLTYSSVEQATEFCLAASANSRRSNEERANNTTVTPPSQQTVAANSTAVVNFTSGERENVAPSPRDAFLSFARQIGHLYSLLELLDVYPALVYRTADLVSVTVKLCGFVAIQPFFALLLGKIVLKEKSIASNLVDTGSDVSKEGYQHLCIGDLAQSLSVHLHLLSLLLHEFGAPLAHLFFFDPEALLSKLFGLTEYAVCYFLKYVTLVDCTAALPKWLTPFLVSLDLYEAAVIEVKRIARIPKCHSLLWQYFDRKWIPHHLWVMRMINSAYQDGETSLRLTINRRRVVIDFSKMTQNNLDSGIHRRVMFHPVPIGEGDKEDDSKRPFPFPALRHVSDENFVLPPLDASYHSRIMKICADLICPQTDPDCLQAVLRLCLRYTRDHSLALMFISSGGVEKLLELRTSQFFNEFTVIVTLIVRHLLEDAPVLDYLMEKAIRDGLNNANVNNNVSWMRDFNYMLRSFEHIACRDLDTFVKVVCRVIRLKASLPSTYERDNPNGLARCPFLNIRCEPRDETQKCPPLGHTSQTVLSALLNYLTRDLEAIGANESEVTTAEGKPATAGQMDNTGDPIASTEGNAPPAPSGQDNDGQTSPSLPSISKSSVLALLAELIHNYPEVPEFFVSYRYPADLVQRSNETKQRSSLQTEPLCSQSCSALAYILDNLLVEELVPNDKDCGAAVKLVIASLASSTQNEEVLSMLVTEVKLALLRALTLTTKCLYKHKRIVAIVSLVTVMKNACPWYDGNSPNRDQNGNRANSVVRWIQKKRLLTDLANVPHYLNLSDPNTITTMNAVLKAMEDIARFVLCPVNAGRSSTQNRTGGDSRGAQQGQQRQLRQANSHRHRHGSSMRQGQVSSNFQDVSFLPNLLMARISVSPISEDGADRSAWNGEQGHPDSANGSRPPDGNNNADGPNDRSLDTSFGRADDMGAMSQDNEDGSAMDISSQEGDMLDDEEVLMVEEEDGQRSTSVTEGEEEEDEEEEDVENDDEEEEDEEDDDEDEEYEEEEEVENEDGHEGSDREEEESEYEDMGRNFEEGLRISMQELAQGADDFDVTLEDDGTFSRLTEALRRALVPQSNHPRSSRELGNSMGFTIPDVEQFLAAGSRSLGLSNAASNVPIGVAHPILLRQPEQQDSNSVGTVSGPGVTHRQLMVVRSTNNWNRGFTSGGYPHGSYRTSILTRRLNPRFRQPRDVFSLVEASLQSHGRMVPYLDFGEASLHSDLPNSTDVDDSVDVTNVIHSSCISWEFESRLLDANYCNIITAAVRTPILDVLHGYYDEEMKALREQEAKAKEAASQQKQQQDADQSQPTANAIGNVQDEPETADMAVENTANVSNMNAEQQQQQQQPDEAGETEAQGATLNNGAPYVPMDETLQVESTPEQPQGGEATASADAAIINPPVPTTQVQSDASLVVVEPASVHSELEMPANEGEGNEAAQAEVVVIHQPDVITVDIVSGPPPPLPPLNPTGLNRVTDPRLRAILGDVELPEGIDPNFLAELPENIREEVISDQLQLLRAQQQSRQAVQRREGTAENSAGENALDSDISYEFLVALPPELQDEVVAQHRLSRHQAQQQQEAPDAPVDLAAFFDTLPRTLREQVLADADDSQIALLPSHIAEEARRLRASTGARDPYHMSVVNSLRQYGVISRFDISRRSAGLRTTLRRHGGRIAGYRRNGTPLFIDSPSEDIYTPSSPPPRIAFGMRCSPLLDKESLSCLIVLFFCHNPGLNATRLHRLFKNLCYEAGTRDWLIRTFLSILDRTYRSATEGAVPKVDWASLEASSGQPTLPDRQGGHSKAPNEIAINTLDLHLQKWLNVVVKSSMGAHIEVFQVRQQRTPGRRSSSMASMNINPLFLPALCCQMIASLTSLAKIFPAAFFPDYSHSEGSAEEGKKTAQKASSSAGPSRRRNDSNDGKQATTTDFWDILVKLDATSIVGKPEGFSKPIPPRHVPSFGYPESVEYASLEEAPFGQLMLMINHPVIAERPYIMNHFLRLLATVANAMDSAKLASIVNRDGGENVFLEDQLKLLIDMHTRCKNGDDSRGDSDSLLTRCAMNLGLATQRRIFDLLVNAAVELAETLSDEIAELMRDLEQEDEHIPSTSTGIPPASSFIRPGIKGTMVDRFTGSTVIVSGGVPHRAACPVSTKELHCASIGKMNEKNSTQVCLLRTATLFLKLKGRVLDVRQPGLNNEQTLPLRRGTNIPVSLRSRQTVPFPASELRGNSREQQDVATDVTVNEQPAAAAAAAPSTSHESKKDAPGQSVTKEELEALCTKLKDNKLWELLSTCLSRLALSSDPHTVLVLQPAVEAFFILHADNKDEMMQLSSLLQSGKPEGEQSSLAAGMDVGQSPTPLDVSTASMSEVSVFSNPGYQKLNPDVQKFVRFAEKHRTVLNQILRQTKVPLNSGPFSVLVNYTRILDFDIKRKYFRRELEFMEHGYRGEDIAVRVKRDRIFQNSFRELCRLRSEQWKGRFYIMFEGEEGQDAGGLLREWFSVITREIFNPNYALFMTSPGDRVTYMINPASYVNKNHLEYFHFIGRLIAKAVFDNKYLDCYFTRAFYKHILGKPVKYTDIESEDPSFYQSLFYLLENPVSQLGYDVTFSLEVEEFGVRDLRDLKENGRHTLVTDQNKQEYVNLVCQMKMTGAIRQQLNAFLNGFYDIIPKDLISIFNEQELELLISGLPIIDVDDLQQNTEYHKYTKSSVQIQWFWRAVRSFDHADRAKLLQFVTGTSRVPLQGFGSLQGMHGVQRFQIHRDDRSVDRLPTAHTCFNQLDLPPYESYEKLRQMLLLAIRECSEGFGFA